MANITGTSGSDILIGTPGDDIIDALGGDDQVWAGAADTGADLFVGGDGDDKIGGGAGNDILIGDNHDGALDLGATGDDGANTLYGGDGDDLLIAGGYVNDGSDVSYAGAAGNAYAPFVTGTGNSTVWAGVGNDIVYGAAGDDELGGGDGDDEVNGGAGNDLIYGGAGNDIINGDAGDDVVFNGAGDDVVNGGAGNDALWGGAGNDVLTGGAGNDTFGFIVGNGADTVTDFTFGQDTLDLQAFAGSFADASAVLAAMTNIGGDVQLNLGGGDTVLFQGKSKADFAAATTPWVNLSGTPEGSPEGSEIFLTSGTDILDGTAGDDQFMAYQIQNPFSGGVSNSLSSADRLDGGAGSDSLYAEILNEFVGMGGFVAPDIQARTTSIEEVLFEARELFDDPAVGNGVLGVVNGAIGIPDDNLVFGGGHVVDAKWMTDIERIGSTYSDASLKIENLTTLTSNGTARNTDSLTIVMDHTENTNSSIGERASDLTVLLDEDYLLSGQTSTGEAQFFLLDQDAELRLKDGNPATTAEGRLDEIDKNGIRFIINGKEVALTFDGALLEESNPNEINTHAAFVAALQPALAQAIANGDLPAGTTVELDLSPVVLFDTGGLRLNQAALQDGSFSDIIPGIKVVSGDGSEVTAVGYTAPDDITGEFNVFGRFADEFEEQEQPITINIELEKVGRAGEGGNLIVGGKELTKEGSGIPVFEVNVIGEDDKPSNLGMMATTNQDLEKIVVRTHPDDLGNDSFASLTIRGLSTGRGDIATAEAFGQNSLDMFDASGFRGDLTLGNVNDIDDLITLNATGGGDVDFTGRYTGLLDNQNYTVTTAGGDDTFDILIDGDAVDAVTESFRLDMGNGANEAVLEVRDSLSTTLGGSANTSGQLDADGVSRATTSLLSNLDVLGGSGVDMVEIRGNGAFSIDVDNNSDMVYINSGGGVARGDLWSPTGDFPTGDAFPDVVVYRAKLAISVAGFESVVDINTGNDFILTEAELNANIIAALEQSPELRRLVETELGTTDQNLIVQALIDGVNEVGLQIRQPELVANAAALIDGTAQVVFAASDLPQMTADLLATDLVTDSLITPAPLGLADSDDVDTVAEVVALFGDTYTGNVGPDGDGHFFGNDLANDGFTGQVFTLIAGAAGDGGSVGGQYNDSIINMGKGSNDLVVLSAYNTGPAASVNTLVFDDTWGKVSIVNFFDQDTTALLLSNGIGNQLNANHQIDVRAFLTNEYTSSGSTQSKEHLGIEVFDDRAIATGFDMEANSFHFVTIDTLEEIADPNANYAFGGLTASQMKALIEQGPAGGITYAAEFVSNGSDGSAGLAVGTTQRTSIIAVEHVDDDAGFAAFDGGDGTSENISDDSNYGEYKLFQVTYGVGDEGDNSTVSVVELGIWDFGDSVDLTQSAPPGTEDGGAIDPLETGDDGDNLLIAFQDNLVGGMDFV